MSKGTIKKDLSKFHKCKECGYNFNTERGLEVHNKYQHSEEAEENAIKKSYNRHQDKLYGRSYPPRQ